MNKKPRLHSKASLFKSWYISFSRTLYKCIAVVVVVVFVNFDVVGGGGVFVDIC